MSERGRAIVSIGLATLVARVAAVAEASLFRAGWAGFFSSEVALLPDP